MALIQHRDGIVGSWAPPANLLPHLVGDADANLARWEPWVRAALVDFDLMCNLQFGTPGGVATLWHFEFQAGTPPTASGSPVVAMTRPPDPGLGAHPQFWHKQLDMVANWPTCDWSARRRSSRR